MPQVHAAELARQLDISKMAISKAFHSGRIAQAGTGPKGQPLFDLDEARRVFVPDPIMIIRPDGLRGGRPVYRQTDKGGRLARRPGAKLTPEDERVKFLIALIREVVKTMTIKQIQAQWAALDKDLQGIDLNQPVSVDIFDRAVVRECYGLYLNA